MKQRKNVSSRRSKALKWITITLYLIVGGFVVLIALKVISGRATSHLPEGYAEYDAEREKEWAEERRAARISKGQRIDVSGFDKIARWDSFTDQDTGSYIASPSLLHDSSTGYVLLVYGISGGEGTFHAYFSSEGKEVTFPVRWSDREVRAFRVLLNGG